jgi:hypothetical protein
MTLQGFAAPRKRVDTKIPDSVLKGSYNVLKRRALEIFNSYGALNPPAWAVLADFIPVRSSYSYLLRLHRFGLLDRTRDKSGLLLYSLSDRGRERLQYLTIPNSPKQSPARLQETTHALRGPNAF